MRILLTFAVLMIWATSFAQSQQQDVPQRTPIVFKEIHNRGKYANVFVQVEAASRRSQVLLFLRYSGQDEYHLATSIEGDPQFPRTRDRLPDPDDRLRRQYKSTWFMNVRLDLLQERPAEIFAVVTELSQRYERNRSTDIEALRYLPFKRAANFNELLAVLDDFGWTPTGFTKSAP
jgi:hypothetical protein